MEGQLTVFSSKIPESPCYCCFYSPERTQVETCSQTGILAPVVGVIGSLQAIEAIKLLIGIGETLIGRLLLLDALNMEWYSIKLVKSPTCPICMSPKLTRE
jgi:adenylyltransferase/sulfurtransferase